MNHLLLKCLICQKLFSNEAIMKPSRLQEHLTKMQADKNDKNLSHFQVLEENHIKHPTIIKHFVPSTKHNSNVLQSSYNILILMSKS